MIVAFGGCELDLNRYELRRGGVRVPLEPQAFTVLAFLVEHRDRVVTKEQLMDEVWGGRFVSEAALTSRIKQIRQAVGDDGRAQQVIRTVHGRGYHFVAPVEDRGRPAPGGSDDEDSFDTGEVNYAESDGLSIAYQITGSGSRDIVLVPGFVSHLELDWAELNHAHFLRRLSGLGRLIRFDKRGTGMSDRPQGLPDLETRMRDVLAVMDAAGSERAVLFGYSEGGPLSILVAAIHPRRVSHLILYGSYAKRIRSDDYPWAPTREDRQTYADRLASEWSWEADLRTMCPSADDAMARWWGRRTRAAATPSTVRALIEMNSMMDVRAVLPAVHAPTLVLHRRGDRDSLPAEGRFLAERIPGAQFIELAGADHFVGVNPDQILDQVEPFLAEPPPRAAGPSALAAVLAGPAIRPSTAAVAGVRTARTAEGEIVALYDGPAAAARAATTLLAGGGPADPEGGLGLHVCEVTVRDGEVSGAGVEVAVEVGRAAAGGELWVTGVTRDLLAATDVPVRATGRSVAVRGGSQPVFAVQPHRQDSST